MPQPKGERNIKAKLAADDVRLIRRLAADGMRNAEIAEKFEVHPNTIWRVVSYRLWGHVYG